MENNAFITATPATDGDEMPRKSKPVPAVKRRVRSKPPIIQTPQELALMGHHVPELLTTEDPNLLFKFALQAQKLLPEDRRRPYKSLELSIKYEPGYFQKTLANIRAAMLDHPIATVAIHAEPDAPKIEDTPPARLVKWGAMHYNQLAHHKALQVLLKDRDRVPSFQTLVDAVIVAQHAVLLSSEWRRRVPLQHSAYTGKLLEGLYRGASMPAPKTIEEPIQAVIDEAVEVIAEMRAAEPSPPAPAAVPEWVEHNEKIAQAAEKPAAPATPGLAEVFGTIGTYLKGVVKGWMAEAVEESEMRVTRRVLGEFACRLEASAPSGAVPKTAEVVDAVRAMMIDLIGAPSAPPKIPDHVIQAPPEERAPPLAQSAARERKPRVDVIGLKGTNCELVRRRCGSLFDLRFLDPDEARHQIVTAPHAIVCRKFVPHTATERINPSIEVIYVEGAARSVVKRLHEMRNHA